MNKALTRRNTAIDQSGGSRQRGKDDDVAQLAFSFENRFVLGRARVHRPRKAHLGKEEIIVMLLLGVSTITGDHLTNTHGSSKRSICLV